MEKHGISLKIYLHQEIEPAEQILPAKRNAIPMHHVSLNIFRLTRYELPPFNMNLHLRFQCLIINKI